jgi:hypothetical protein
MSRSSEENRYLFDLQGYLVIPGMLSTREVDELNRVIDRLPDSIRGASSPHAHRGLPALPSPNGTAPGSTAPGSTAKPSADPASAAGILGWGPEVRRLVSHPRLVPYLTMLIGPEFRLDHQYAVFQRHTPGRGVPNPLHNGAVPFRPTCYYLVQDGSIHNAMVVVQFTLADTPPGAGGFCCVPGSHKANFALPASLRDTMEGPRSIARHVPLAAGDVLIFTEALTHGALPWHAPHERRALLFKYCPGHMQWRPGSAPADLDDWTQTQRRVLRAPYAMDREPTSATRRNLAEHWLRRRAYQAVSAVRARQKMRYVDSG